MIARLASLRRRLARDESGTSLVEFGFFAPFLALLVGGAIDLSMGLSDRFTLQQAVNRSLEMLQARHAVADADDADVDYSYLEAEAAAAAGVPVEQVSVTRWLECDGVEEEDYSAVCADGEDTARYLELRIDSTFEGQFFLGTTAVVATGAVRIQ